MEQWSILSNVLNYVEERHLKQFAFIQHSRFHSMKHMLDIKAVNKYKSKPNTDNREFKELDFGAAPQNCKKNTWTYMREFTQT